MARQVSFFKETVYTALRLMEVRVLMLFSLMLFLLGPPQLVLECRTLKARRIHLRCLGPKLLS